MQNKTPNSKFLLSKSPSLWSNSYFKKQNRSIQNKAFNRSVGKTLHQNRQLMNITISNSKQILNCSYNNFYTSQGKYLQLISEAKKKKKHSQLQGITSNSSARLSQKRIDLGNKLQPVTQYRFHTKMMANKCFDSTFPKVRYGSTLVSCDSKLFLFGGYSQKGMGQALNMHKYDFEQNNWVQVNTCLQKSRRNIMYGLDPPSISCCYHTAESYKNHLLFIGGMGMDIFNKKRVMNSDINFFNTDRKQWGRIRWSYCVRSHASTIYGSTLVVYGGINQKDEYLNQIRLITLNNLNLSHSYHYELGIKNFYKTADQAIIQKCFHQPIAHHQMVNTYEVDPSLLKDMPINAIFVFGGKKSNGKVDNVLRYMDYHKLIQLGQNTTTKVKISQLWSVAQVSGQKPEGRYCHSMTIIKKKGLALVVGGKNAYGNTLSDSWVLDFVRLSWIKVLYVQHQNPIPAKGGISGHSTTCINNHFYIFGGIFGNNQFNTAFWDMNYQFKRVERKSNKLIRSSKVKISFVKDVFCSEQTDQVQQ